ncbi:MAG: ATP-binding protein [Anaerolineaceae bacterium]|nr:ATP-binding protein [Anaerolineaceae bacterium]
MQIAVASGKGGTGKTTIATSLALSLSNLARIRFFDCDVEAPNSHIFLKPRFEDISPAVIQIPQIQIDKCTACGRCVEVCEFHALAQVGRNILVFPQLCHGCGSCTWNCPENAIIEVPNQIGTLERGVGRENIEFFRGQLTISEPMATPIIRQLKKMGRPAEGTIDIFDAPPGASCSVVETLHGVDFALLVTEPTPFGLHDLKQMLGILRDLNIPAGLVINRDGIGDDSLVDIIEKQQIPVLLRVPFDRKLAESLAAGQSLVDVMPSYRQVFMRLYQQISKLVEGSKK